MADRGIAVLDAPSVLGLRPPAPGRVPGCWRLPEALRRHGLVERLHAAAGAEVQSRVDVVPEGELGE